MGNRGFVKIVGGRRSVVGPWIDCFVVALRSLRSFVQCSLLFALLCFVVALLCFVVALLCFVVALLCFVVVLLCFVVVLLCFASLLLRCCFDLLRRFVRSMLFALLWLLLCFALVVALLRFAVLLCCCVAVLLCCCVAVRRSLFVFCCWFDGTSLYDSRVVRSLLLLLL